jgi:hypothetical protein
MQPAQASGSGSGSGSSPLRKWGPAAVITVGAVVALVLVLVTVGGRHGARCQRPDRAGIGAAG